jgi:hypothetical protein
MNTFAKIGVLWSRMHEPARRQEMLRKNAGANDRFNGIALLRRNKTRMECLQRFAKPRHVGMT